METLAACSEYDLPNHYLAGGAITQCVWNFLVGKPLMSSVKDFDVIYFAEEPHETEARHEVELNDRVGHGIPVEVKNQAYVHEWYPERFGLTIEPYRCSEDGVASWLPAFAVGVMLVADGLRVFAPFGLDDLMSMHLRPNKSAMSEANYRQMTLSYRRRWPQISVQSWWSSVTDTVVVRRRSLTSGHHKLSDNEPF